MDTLVDEKDFTEESYSKYFDEVSAIVDSIAKVNTKAELEALDAVAKATDAQKLLKRIEAAEPAKVTGDKLSYTNSGEARGTEEFEEAQAATLEAATNMLKANLSANPDLTSGAATTGDLKAWLTKFKTFFGKGGTRRSEFVFEAFKRKLFRECKLSEAKMRRLTESLTEFYTGDSSKLTEEYHTYTTPVEAKAVEDLESRIKGLETVLTDGMTNTGYDFTVIDADGYLAAEDTYSYRLFIESRDTFEPGELEDIESHLTDIVEAAVLQMPVAKELKGITGSVVFPDPALADADDAVTRGLITFDIVFARNIL